MTGQSGTAEPRRYLVTGACGGLGSAVAASLAARGHVVYAADADRNALKSISRGSGLIPIPMDVTDSGSVQRARRAISRTAKSLDGIICAAGIYVGGPLLDISADEIRRALDVNVMGVVFVVKEMSPLLREGSRLVFVSSESTRAAMPFTGPYVMSKLALEAFADTLRRELLPFRMPVILIQPGAIRTPLLKSAARSLNAGSVRPQYAPAIRSAQKVLGREMETGMEPARVASVITGELARRRPKRWRRVGNDPLRAFVSFLPGSWVDAFMRKFLART